MIKRIMAFFLIAVLMAAIGFSASAENLKDTKKQQQQVQSEMKEISGEKAAEKATLINNKKVRDEIINKLEKEGYQKSQIEEQIKQIESAIKTLNGNIKQTETEYDNELKLFQERLVVLYMRSRVGSDMTEIASSDDFNELFKRLHTIQLVARVDQQLMESIDRKKADIEALKLQRREEIDNCEAKLEESLKNIKTLEVSRSQAESRIEATNKHIQQLELEEDALERENKELTALIKKLSSTSSYTGGVMRWPLPGYSYVSASGQFGWRPHPILKYKKFHGGIDIGAPQGTYIVAANNGKVVLAGYSSSNGNYIIIDHGGGMTTLYLHIMKKGILVSEGQTVKAGDVIAKVGMTGLATGPHLHFEVRKNGERQQPFNYVKPPK